MICGLFLWLGALVAVKASPGTTPSGVDKAPAVLKNPASAAPARVAASPQTPAQASSAKYVGEETCLTCHEAQKKGYVESPHHRAADPRTPAAAQSCETCHGPGSEHASDPVKVGLKNFKTATPADINATCTTCHDRGEHALWTGSTHEQRGLACTTCHSIHSSKSPEKQLKAKTQMELCANCHRDKVAKLDRSGHMPVREGKMQCTSCHNTHGSTNVRMLRKGDSVAELCTSCHAEKRGPFLWEHPPARDGCVTCHDPHGSSNERMLVARPPILCQRCHVATQHPSTIYDAGAVATSIRVYARSCVTCHAAIHGSNHPSGQRFIR